MVSSCIISCLLAIEVLFFIIREKANSNQVVNLLKTYLYKIWRSYDVSRRQLIKIVGSPINPHFKTTKTHEINHIRKLFTQCLRLLNGHFRDKQKLVLRQSRVIYSSWPKTIMQLARSVMTSSSVRKIILIPVIPTLKDYYYDMNYPVHPSYN